MSDEELIQVFREVKAETGGRDPELTPPDDSAHSAVGEEMERRGLTPDREDIVPDAEIQDEETVVEDHA